MIVLRVESSISIVLAYLGGYWSIIASILVVLDIFENVQLKVASSLVADEENEVN